MFDADEILDAAELKSNAVTRTLVTVVYYTICVVAYPFVVLKHLFKK